MQKNAFRSGGFVVASPYRPAWRRNLNQTMLIMRLTVLLLTTAFLNVQATGKAQHVNLSGKNLTLQEVFKVIEKQTGYVFLASEGLFTHTKTVSVTAKNMPVSDLLETVLKDQAIKYVIKGKTIVLSPRFVIGGTADRLSSLLDVIRIRVRVVDANGNALPRASVSVKNKKTSGVTDAEGYCSLEASENDILILSFIGFESKQIKLLSSESAIDLSTDQQKDNKPGFVSSRFSP